MRKCKTLAALTSSAASLDRLVDREREIDSLVDEKEGITREDAELALLHLERESVLVPDWHGGQVYWGKGREVEKDEPLRGFAMRLTPTYREALLRGR